VTKGPKATADVTRFVVISDTHGKHREIHLPPGDILIHGGDFTKTGEIGTIEDLALFFGQQLDQNKYESIVCIAGNHDMSLDTTYYMDEKNWYCGATLPHPHRSNPRRFQRREEDTAAARRAITRNCHYLEDTCHTTKNGIVVYGSPWSPIFYHWGFNAERGDEINAIWDKIPIETDVLITHGPPLGRGDMTGRNDRAGCYDLLMHIQNRVKPRVSIFGHIHEGYGTEFDGQTVYINASNCNIDYNVFENFPIVFDLPHDRSIPAKIVQPDCRHIASAADLVDYCNRIGLQALATGLNKCEPTKLPSGNDLIDLDAGIHKIVEALHDANVEGLTNLHRTLIRDFRPKLYADSFHRIGQQTNNK
jgi:Calcineurin-like phosphoesterase